MPHAQHALKSSAEFSSESRFRLSHKVGHCLIEDRRFEEAIVTLQDTVRWGEQYLEQEDSRPLLSEHELARAYFDSRRIPEAIQIFEHVIDIRQITLPEEDNNRLGSEQALASAYLYSRRIPEAINILEHIIAILSSNRVI